MVGKTLGHYEILEPLGAGGMGEVYRARDTQLDRDVALKLLPESFATDPDRLMRFEREAKTLAALNHPGIAQVYGLERSGPQQAIVMELVPGPTLEEAIGANSELRRSASDVLEWALPIARQLAEALETAHEAGIIHRDLKPANIKVGDDGTVKVLDFGLAKAFDPHAVSGEQGAPGSVPDANSPTMTSPALTAMGVILGTAAYMAPEQARGKPVDRRVDIWAFGCVLYEMLTGAAPFEGETITDVLAAVVKETPDWEALPAELPRSVRRLLERCLEKDPRRRLRDIGDARLELEDVARSPGEPGDEGSEVRPRALRGWMFAAAAVVAVVAFFAGSSVAPEPEAPVLRLDVDFGGDLEVQTDIALSRDGERVAFVGRDDEGRDYMATRRLEDGQVTRLRQLDGRFGTPFFSFDGRSIGVASEGEVLRVPVDGGPVTTITDGVTNYAGVGRWGVDEILLVMTFAGLSRISVSDGTSTIVESRAVDFLPDGRSMLVSSMGEMGVLAPGEEEPQQVAPFAGISPRYLSSGHLLFLDDGVLHVVPFDLSRLQAEGAPIPLVEGVRWFTASDTGTVIFGRRSPSFFQRRLSWFDEAGRLEPVIEEPGDYGSPQLSPDGRLVAYTVDDGTEHYVAIFDLDRGTTRRLTPPGLAAGNPLWMPDGVNVLFRSRDRGVQIMRADGSGAPRRLFDTDGSIESISPDGLTIALNGHEQTPEAGRDIHWVSLTGAGDELRAGPPEPVLASPADEINPRFSPDGRWMAYSTSESGVYRVNVLDVRNPASRWEVSPIEGFIPQWARRSDELFFRGLGGAGLGVDAALFVAGYSVNGDAFVPGTVRPFGANVDMPSQGATSVYTVAEDGRVLGAIAVGSSDVSGRSHGVIMNVQALVERRQQEAAR